MNGYTSFLLAALNLGKSHMIRDFTVLTIPDFVAINQKSQIIAYHNLQKTEMYWQNRNGLVLLPVIWDDWRCLWFHVCIN